MQLIKKDGQNTEEESHFDTKRDEKDEDQYASDERGQELGGHVPGYTVFHLIYQMVVVGC